MPDQPDTDIIAALVALLKADAGVAALAGDHIYGVELPKAAVGQMPLHALVIQPSGGAPLTGASDAELDTQRFDLISYGPTPAAANALRLKAAPLLRHTKRKVVSGVLIHWINKAGGFYAARERDGLWPQSFQSFQTLYSTQEI
jgi:hypothetical protein